MVACIMLACLTNRLESIVLRPSRDPHNAPNQCGSVDQRSLPSAQEIRRTSEGCGTQHNRTSLSVQSATGNDAETYNNQESTRGSHVIADFIVFVRRVVVCGALWSGRRSSKVPTVERPVRLVQNPQTAHGVQSTGVAEVLESRGYAAARQLTGHSSQTLTVVPPNLAVQSPTLKLLSVL